jgi:4'-phosphopantetheinyl transferase
MMSTIAPGEVHIWLARRPPNNTEHSAAALSTVERDRAGRFHFPKDRLAYEFAHTVLREVLSGYLHCFPEQIEFGQNAFGKPFNEGPHRDAGIEFNLSHAGDVVLIGVCGERRIGVDIEQIRPTDELLAIASSSFTHEECAFVLEQKPADWPLIFLRCWTRKEACVKAMGSGISFPLNSFDTQISRLEPSGFVTGLGDSTATPWQITELHAPDGYVASVAVESGIEQLIYFEWHAREEKIEAQRT